MVDELFDRTYQAGRAELNAGLARGFRAFREALRNAFVVLNRIEYQAPWSESARKPHCN